MSCQIVDTFLLLLLLLPAGHVLAEDAYLRCGGEPLPCLEDPGMILHPHEKSFEVLVIYFFGLAHGPCVGVVAGSELLLILEAMLALRVPELIFTPNFCLLCCSVIGGEVVEIIEECVHVDAR